MEGESKPGGHEQGGGGGGAMPRRSWLSHMPNALHGVHRACPWHASICITVSDGHGTAQVRLVHCKESCRALCLGHTETCQQKLGDSSSCQGILQVKSKHNV